MGIIKEIYWEKGYGFIYQDDEKIYFKIEDIEVNNKNEIQEGKRVTFQKGVGDNGRPRAFKIRIENGETNEDSRQAKKQINYFLPFDTNKMLKNRCSIVDEMDNLNLKLNKYAFFKDNKFILFKKDRKGGFQYQIKLDLKRNDLVGMMNKIRIRQANTIKEGYDNFKEINYKPNGKFVNGLGLPSVYEVSLNLHHIYGIPYIPSSSIKGITRMWVLKRYFNGKEEEAEKEEWFCKIFGTNTKRGEIIFFDSYPDAGLKIDFDIINPHFADYYTKNKKPPLDTENPNPIYFLVLKDASFNIYISIKDNDNFVIKHSEINGNALDVTKYFIKRALEEIGLGAKTALGYGVVTYQEMG
ncbi:MAG TPA: type III-B CRISPR module RAMP protein Cmr6 [Pseudobacteroides sp.]|nr:type III-B CRISPR module RAMP protein Cmr6 [Pseudobacteroides sp.]